MQKTETKASILIWSIFLSLILIMTFVSISTKINKNLKNNSQIIQNIKNWATPVWDLLNYTWSLYKWETEEIKIEGDPITINILHGWPILYKNNTATGIINTTTTMTPTTGSIFLKNLWWYTKYTINSNNFIPQYNSYKITQKIWNKTIERTSGEIKNF